MNQVIETITKRRSTRSYEQKLVPKEILNTNKKAGKQAPFVCCSLACENMMIATTSLGLGSCYVGFGVMVKGNPEIEQALELTKDERIYGPILLGYPKVNPGEAVTKALESIGPNKKDPIVKWI